MADMILNDDEMNDFFNFADIVDEPQEVKSSAKTSKVSNSDKYDDVDFLSSELFSEEEGDEEEAEDEELEDEEDGDEDSEYEDDEEITDEEIDEVEQFTKTFTEKWDVIDDDHVFDFGDVQLTKADLADAAMAREEHKQLRDSLMNYANEFQSMNKMSDDAFQAARTETEGYLHTIKEKLRRGEYKGEAKVKAYDDIERLEARQAKLNEAVAKTREINEAREAKMAELRLNLVDKEMSNRYGKNWGTQIAPTVVNYAKERGISQDLLVKHASPELLEVLIKAAKFDSLEGNNKEKVKKVMKQKNSGKVARSVSSTTRQEKPSRKMSQKRAYDYAMASGNPSAAFDLLVD